MDFSQVQLTRNFWLREFLRSESAARAGIDMTPSEDIVTNLTRLCNTVLQPLRDELDAAFVIQSGYRPAALNTMIGGSKTSAHMYGRAADCNALHIPTIGLCRMIVARIASYPIDQVIYEYGQWCHIGIAPVGALPRRQVLSAVYREGKTVYLTGLVEK